METTISRRTPGGKALAVLAFLAFHAIPSLKSQEVNQSNRDPLAKMPSLSKDKGSSAGIDTKPRQVFIEAALVQVTSDSALNYTIELLARDPYDEAARSLFDSFFGLKGIDFEHFNKIFPDVSDPATARGILAIMNRGKLPAIIRFFKTNRDAQILATPFVLADDNMKNNIDITETRYVQNTTMGSNQVTFTTNQAEQAGIKLGLTPKISEDKKTVVLKLELEVSEFTETSSGVVSTLPPKISNILRSSVTIPDGQVFVVGGLPRQGKSKSVSKIPILGKLFRSEATAQYQSNLYIFLQAHILTD